MNHANQNETSQRHQIWHLALFIGLLSLGTGCRLVDGTDPGVQALILNSMAVSASNCSDNAAVAESYSCQPVVSIPENTVEIDVSQLTWELTPENTCSWIQINPTTGQVFGVPSPNEMGRCTLALRVATAETSSTDFAQQLTVNGPRLAFVDQNCSTSVAVDNAYSCTLKTSSPLADAKVTYTLAPDNKCKWASVQTSTGQVTGTPPLTAVGSCQLVVVAAIDTIASAVTRMTISVPQVAVKVTASCPANISAGADFACSPSATAPVTSPTFTWSLSAANSCSWAVINATTGAISGAPLVHSTGPCRLDITAKLPNGSSGQFSSTVYVGVKGFNQFQLSDLDVEANDNAGHAIAFDGNYAVIGSPNDNGGVGSATIYEFDGGRWRKIAFFAAPDSKMRSFGYAVALSGSSVLVSAPNTTNLNTRDGSIVAYERSGSTWSQAQILTPAAGVSKSQLNLGSSLDMFGSNAIVGTSHYGAPAAYILTKSGTTWSVGSALDFSAVGSAVGTGRIKVAIHGTMAVVSDLLGGASKNGEIHVFKASGAVWKDSGVISSIGAANFGFSVDVYNNKILVGSPDEKGNAGAAYLYQEGANSWTQTQYFRAPDESSMQRCGESVSLTDTMAAVGCPGSDTKLGSVYIYADNSITWKLASKVVPSNVQSGDRFGSAISYTGYDLMVGAEFYDAGAAGNAGTAYIFRGR